MTMIISRLNWNHMKIIKLEIHLINCIKRKVFSSLQNLHEPVDYVNFILKIPSLQVL